MLTWTTEPPKVPGWYFRRGFNCDVLVFYIDTDIYHVETRHDLYEEWSGPIPEPVDNASPGEGE